MQNNVPDLGQQLLTVSPTAGVVIPNLYTFATAFFESVDFPHYAGTYQFLDIDAYGKQRAINENGAVLVWDSTNLFFGFWMLCPNDTDTPAFSWNGTRWVVAGSDPEEIVDIDSNFTRLNFETYVPFKVVATPGDISLAGDLTVAGDSSVSDLTVSGKINGIKKYVALLTQTPPGVLIGGTLEIGRVYEITNTGNETIDFVNCGAPDNNLGTQFVATNDTPDAWGMGELTSFGEPVAAVLENSLGVLPVWNYDAPGHYILTLPGGVPGGFPTQKTVAICNPVDDSDLTNLSPVKATAPNGDIIEIFTGGVMTATDGLLSNTAISITIYP